MANYNEPIFRPIHGGNKPADTVNLETNNVASYNKKCCSVKRPIENIQSIRQNPFLNGTSSSR